MPYTIEEHHHRLAAWDAGRSASVKGCRFKVHQAKAILEACDFNAAFSRTEHLPSPENIDRTHKKWREAIIKAAKRRGLNFTHGVAAKLINCYLKVRFVCAGQHEHKRVKCLHPPIDNVMLDELVVQDYGGFKKQWRQFRKIQWSKFDSAAYQSVIDHIRKSLPENEPLWKIEEFWKGYQ
jgi:hypothetical protein